MCFISVIGVIEMLPCCARPGGELKPTEDHLEGLKRLLNEVCFAVCALCGTYCSECYFTFFRTFSQLTFLALRR